MSGDPTERTIEDFGRQWTNYTRNEGYYGSLELFRDICGPLFDPDDLEDARVLDVGSGTGRIVRMLVAAGAREVVAVEPSDAFEVLREATADLGARVQCQHARGDTFDAAEIDVAVSIGVLHHIPDPEPTVARMHAALRSGGRCLIWLYGREGNRAYLAVAQPLRMITTRLPQPVLAALSHAIVGAMLPYGFLCRALPLPLADYLRTQFTNLSWRARALVIFDQLNPAYAKYYTHDEAVELLERAGFTAVSAHHRHGYSWTVVGHKPVEPLAEARPADTQAA